MRIILDECVSADLLPLFSPHAVTTVPLMGWANLKNGALLKQIGSEFDVFVTTDRNPRFQQNLQGIPFAILVLLAPSNRIEHLALLVPEALLLVQTIQPGDYREIGSRPPRRWRKSQSAPLV